MIGIRKGEAEPYSDYRPSRFFNENGHWYFHTREGSTEGPFPHRVAAEEGLELHIRIFRDLQLEVFDSGFYALADKLKLEPIQMQWR